MLHLSTMMGLSCTLTACPKHRRWRKSPRFLLTTVLSVKDGTGRWKLSRHLTDLLQSALCISQMMARQGYTLGLQRLAAWPCRCTSVKPCRTAYPSTGETEARPKHCLGLGMSIHLTLTLNQEIMSSRSCLKMVAHCISALVHLRIAWWVRPETMV